MTAQNLSSEELHICALLYTTKESILFATTTLFNTNDEAFRHFQGRLNRQSDNTFRGTWYKKPFISTSKRIIQSLIAVDIIIHHEEHNQPFYTLNICDEFKAFFDELEVQIALGSIC